MLKIAEWCHATWLQSNYQHLPSCASQRDKFPIDTSNLSHESADKLSKAGIGQHSPKDSSIFKDITKICPFAKFSTVLQTFRHTIPQSFSFPPRRSSPNLQMGRSTRKLGLLWYF